jgi:hypothetical protein
MYYNERVIALIPVIALLIDYVLTFILAGSMETLLRYEASPLLRFAVASDLVIPVILALMVFYYLASCLVLAMLSDTSLYPLGVTLIILVGLTHLLGGLSWYIKDTLYSDTVIGLSLVSILVAIIIFGYTLFRAYFPSSVTR